MLLQLEPRDQLNFGRTCRALKFASDPFIYRNIQIDLDHYHTGLSTAPWKQLLYVLMDRTNRLIDLSKSLHVCGTSDENARHESLIHILLQRLQKNSLEEFRFGVMHLSVSRYILMDLSKLQGLSLKRLSLALRTIVPEDFADEMPQFPKLEVLRVIDIATGTDIRFIHNILLSSPRLRDITLLFGVKPSEMRTDYTRRATNWDTDIQWAVDTYGVVPPSFNQFIDLTLYRPLRLSTSLVKLSLSKALLTETLVTSLSSGPHLEALALRDCVGLSYFLEKLGNSRLRKLLIHHDRRLRDDLLLTQFISGQNHLEVLFTSTQCFELNLMTNLRILSMCEIQDDDNIAKLGEMLQHATRLEQLSIRWPVVRHYT